ncbi:alpha/beta fold hydrolase [Azospirillum picis]|uniref:Pimeloyl-ACP methyl ester carboxylesterase n=1 Tax=Azospirillum picis TaxID=488438 RepID=A0ABU0MMC2_9PROT|nr:alpha/beta hydrolase [Azospirillum picis]MBP2300654.1 pimeloyl-ACP methyl ester carboxylesterase [Azospirillum picis]MDQ0534623.1 pimeloyl-ACP methyl ester carboxylesterase [Azospirillum picis]
MIDRDPYVAYNIRIYGSGPETIIFAHGLGLDQRCWDEIKRNFVDRYRVVVYDLVGFTKESVEHFDHHKYRSMTRYVEDLLLVIKHTNSKSCYYVGHSVSGMIGLLASMGHPGLFKKIVTIGLSPSYVNSDDYNGGFDKEDIDQLIDNISSNYVEWAKEFSKVVVAKPAGHPAVLKFADGLIGMRPDIALSLALMIFSSDFRDVLGKVTVPCHLIQTVGDPAVPVSVGRYVQSRIPGSSLEIIDAEGHIPQFTHAEVLSDAILRALEE